MITDSSLTCLIHDDLVYVARVPALVRLENLDERVLRGALPVVETVAVAALLFARDPPVGDDADECAAPPVLAPSYCQCNPSSRPYTPPLTASSWPSADCSEGRGAA